MFLVAIFAHFGIRIGRKIGQTEGACVLAVLRGFGMKSEWKIVETFSVGLNYY